MSTKLNLNGITSFAKPFDFATEEEVLEWLKENKSVACSFQEKIYLSRNDFFVF